MGEELTQTERLLQHVHAVEFGGRRDDVIVAVARHEQAGQARTFTTQLGDEIHAGARAGQYHLAEHEIDLQARLEQGAPRVTIFGGHHLVADRPQTAHDGLTYRRFVLDHEDAFAAAHTVDRLRLRDVRLCRAVRDRQQQRDRRADALRAAHLDGATRLGHEAVDHGETETRSDTHGLRAEERFVGPRQHRIGHPVPRVLDAHLDVVARWQIVLAADQAAVAGTHGQMTTRGHGVTRVDGEIEQRRLELGHIHEGAVQARSERQVQFHPFAEGRAQEHRQGLETRREIDGFGPEHLTPGEGRC